MPLRRFGSQRLKSGVRIALGIVLFVNELGWHWWALTFDTWSPRYMLPLHICSVFTWLGVVMLLWKSYPIFELAYFLGIGGALQALLTPDARIYGFPHFRAFQSFISHGLVFAGPVFMAVVEGYRPTLRSLGRVLLWGNLYLIPVYFLNRMIGSNYMYLNAKPPTASILDVLGPWPWYVLAMEAFALVTISLLYVPYAVRDLRERWRMRGCSEA